MSLIEGITLQEIKKLFPNRTLKINYLNDLANRLGNPLGNLTTANIDEKIIATWDYPISKDILRSLFSQSEKYFHNRNCRERINLLMNEWMALNLGSFEWPFMPQLFDQYVHLLNRRNISEEEKDQILSSAAIKFRRIKDLNATRNDFIEYLIFEHNENVIPTFSNVRGVDFYINGNPFDQKVSKSVSKSFIIKYGENYRQIAINQPSLVAKCLYESQDEERFGYEPRLFIIYLDSDLSIEDIEHSLQTVDFARPIEIEFEYSHSHNTPQTYRTHCYVVLLHH